MLLGSSGVSDDYFGGGAHSCYNNGIFSERQVWSLDKRRGLPIHIRPALIHGHLQSQGDESTICWPDQNCVVMTSGFLRSVLPITIHTSRPDVGYDPQMRGLEVLPRLEGSGIISGTRSHQRIIKSLGSGGQPVDSSLEGIANNYSRPRFNK